MIIVMTSQCAAAGDRPRCSRDRADGQQAHLSRGEFRTVIGAVGEEGTRRPEPPASLDGVEKVVPIMKPYKLASREFHEDDSVVEIGGGKVPKVKVGGTHAACIAGPCAVENEKMLWNDRPPRPRRRRDGPSRRRLQAAHLALLVPGPRASKR